MILFYLVTGFHQPENPVATSTDSTLTLLRVELLFIRFPLTLSAYLKKIQIWLISTYKTFKIILIPLFLHLNHLIPIRSIIL